MLVLIARVLAGDRAERHAAIEAGTGTGKSYAYLVPTMLWAAETGQRVVVATGTKNLQEQLVKKDAPFVQELIWMATGKRPRVAVLFGKNNYLCPRLLTRRLEELWAKANASLAVGVALGRREQEELCWLDLLAAWLEDSGSGFKDHLPAWPYLPGAAEDRDYWWGRVSAADEDADCPHCTFKAACGFRKARDEAALADVVIANHHLVLADLLLRRKAGLSLFTPRKGTGKPPEVLVVDEAHDLPDAARGALEAAFSRRRVSRLRADALRFFRELRDWAEEAGLVAAEYATDKFSIAEDFDRREFPRLERDLDALFAWARNYLAGEECRSLHPGAAPPVEKLDLPGKLSWFFVNLFSFVERVVEAVGAEVEGDRDLEREFDPFARRAERLAERWEELWEAFCRAVLLERHYRLAGQKGDVCYVERPERFVAHPADPAPVLRGLWSCYDHVFLASATLFPFPQSEGFSWFRERFGFGEEELAMGVVPSPFDYERQMQAVVLTNKELAPPDGDRREETGEQYVRRVETLARAVLRTLEKVDGGVLALFTSYREMRDVAGLVERSLPAGRALLVQGEAGKSELLERFKEHGRAVLFGVASFWQGVDVPGSALSAVLIARLPFPRPDDPDVEAECWLAGQRKRWVKVYLPRASLALRQGVGRLIRTEADTGLVVIADPRAAGVHKRLVRNCVPVELKEAVLAWDGKNC